MPEPRRADLTSAVEVDPSALTSCGPEIIALDSAGEVMTCAAKTCSGDGLEALAQ
jgi:hypothetical protein